MNTKLQKQISQLPDTPEGLDPLKRVFVPIEQKTSDGRVVFATHDKTVYERKPNGQIINRSKQFGGKTAKKMRRKLREQAQHANA